jgi:hypothetical protein
MEGLLYGYAAEETVSIDTVLGWKFGVCNGRAEMHGIFIFMLREK